MMLLSLAPVSLAIAAALDPAAALPCKQQSGATRPWRLWLGQACFAVSWPYASGPHSITVDQALSLLVARRRAPLFDGGDVFRKLDSHAAGGFWHGAESVPRNPLAEDAAVISSHWSVATAYPI